MQSKVETGYFASRSPIAQITQPGRILVDSELPTAQGRMLLGMALGPVRFTASKRL